MGVAKRQTGESGFSCEICQLAAFTRFARQSTRNPHIPQDWQFTRSSLGRPELVGAPLPLRFSLTHTRGLAACVITQGVDCGVDAEQLSVRRHAVGIAERMFAAEELAALNALEGQAFLEYFYACWTLREAYCKARGLGLARCGREVHFVSDPVAGWQLRGRGGGTADWQLGLEQATDSHLVAVAVRTPGCAFDFREFIP